MIALARAEEGTKPVEFTAVPYFAWDHRAAGEMAVWLPDDPKLAKPVPKPTLANTSKASASHVNPTDTLDALAVFGQRATRLTQLADLICHRQF